jgi:uncharacterized protein
VELSEPGPLDRSKPYKPLDFGNGIVSGSVTPSGRWLSIGMAHPVHGRVELTAMPPFSADRFEQSDVRAYRAALADPARPSFGFDLLDTDAVQATLVADSLPRGLVEREEARLESIVLAPPGRNGAVQLVRIAAKAALRGLTWSGQPRLARAEYTQLTLGGRLPNAQTDNRVSWEQRIGWDETIYLIDDRALGASAAIVAPGLEAGAGTSAAALFAVAVAQEPWPAMSEARELAREAARLESEALAERRRLWTGIERGSWSTRRAIAYAVDCAASRTGDVVAMLADHQILPLVWTRDAYYVCRMLLAAGIRVPVEGFIGWTFDVAERVDGWWPRASLASGRVKDPAFQLDQQVWPLLLIADHARLTGDSAVVARHEREARRVLDALLARRGATGLVATDETPADDPLTHPYHFSSHVLLWRALKVFAHPQAAAVRSVVMRRFKDRGRFAYAIGGPEGTGALHYHDANDLPTVFAPGWGFCTAGDALWRATIAFAWTGENPAYFTGPFGGLGSVHTPYPWPLGDLQEIVLGRVMKDPQRERRAAERLARVETWDGLLPEAYDARTGAVASRHWFAWPAALRALLELEPMLTAP